MGKAADRLHKYMKENELTRKAAAEKLNVSPSQLGKYLSAVHPVPADTADRLQTLTGVPMLYWMGSSDATTWDELRTEVTQNALNREAIEEHKLKAFFEYLGLSAERLPSAAYEFLEVAKLSLDDLKRIKADELSKGDIKIRIEDFGSDSFAVFTDAELAELLRKIRYFVEFECYLKRKKEE